MEYQGILCGSNPLYQDNESARKLKVNERTSAGQKSCYINIRYFWVKDVIAREKLEVKHCPTESMLADFFTKPLQGGLFRRLRDVVMGFEHTDTLLTLSPSKERVEGTNISKGYEPSGPSDVTSNKTCKKVPNGQTNCERPSYADVVASQKNKALTTSDQNNEQNIERCSPKEFCSSNRSLIN